MAFDNPNPNDCNGNYQMKGNAWQSRGILVVAARHVKDCLGVEGCIRGG